MNKLIVIASVIVATASADGGAGAYAGAMTVGTTAAHGAGTYAAHGAHGAMHGAHGLAGYGSTLGHMAAMGTAASFSGPLAVLGLLKIGAAAFMALNYFRAQVCVNRSNLFDVQGPDSIAFGCPIEIPIQMPIELRNMSKLLIS